MTTASRVDRASWLHDARWGLFMHFISDAPDKWMQQGGVVPGKWTCDAQMSPAKWNEIVKGFNVEALARQLAELDAGYFCLTIGQNSGYYCAPNETYDRIVGVKDPALSKCSRRDLVAELHAALARHGIRLLVYLPPAPPARDPNAILSFEYAPKTERFYTSWTDEDAVRRYEEMSRAADARLTSFQRKWEAVITEWSLRWGAKISGWWIDGCYEEPFCRIHKSAAAPNFESFAAALRAGNPDCIVCLNPGVVYPARRVDAIEDFTAGEVGNGDDIRRASCIGRYESGAQFHVLAPLGVSWAKGPVARTPERVLEEVSATTSFGGAVTWDVPFEKDGSVSPEAFSVLEKFSKLFAPLRERFDKPFAGVPRHVLRVLRQPEASLSGELLAGVAELSLTNTGSTPLDCEVGLAADGPLLVEPASIPCSLVAGASMKREISLKPLKTSGVGTLRILNGVLSESLETPIRRRFKIKRSSDRIGLAGVKAALANAEELRFKSDSGLDGGSLRFGVFGDRLALFAAVKDLKVETNSAVLYAGSSLEIYFAVDDKSKVKQLFLVPETSSSKAALHRIDWNFYQVEGSECESREISSGYEIFCLLPAQAAFGSEAFPESFLFETNTVATLVAGSKREKASLFGSKSAFKSQAFFARVL